MSTTGSSELQLSDIVCKPLITKLETKAALIARLSAEKTNGPKNEIVQKLSNKRRAPTMDVSSRAKVIRLEHPEPLNLAQTFEVDVAAPTQNTAVILPSASSITPIVASMGITVPKSLPHNFVIPKVEFNEYDEALDLSIASSFTSNEQRLRKNENRAESLYCCTIPRNTNSTIVHHAGEPVCLTEPFISNVDAMFQQTFIEKMKEDAKTLEAAITEEFARKPIDDFDTYHANGASLRKNGETDKQFEKRMRKNAISRKSKQKAKLLSQLKQFTNELCKTNDLSTLKQLMKDDQMIK